MKYREEKKNKNFPKNRRSLYRIAPDSVWSDFNEKSFIEYKDTADFYEIFKYKYSSINNSITTYPPAEKEKLIKAEFEEFIEEHIQYTYTTHTHTHT